MTQNEPATQGSSTASEENRRQEYGEVSYVEIPSIDAGESARFYEKVFGWNISGDTEHRHFDASGFIGAFVTGRTVSREPGILPYIYVERFDETLDLATANGGEVVRPPFPEGALWVATFRDPAGNVIGIYHRGPR